MPPSYPIHETQSRVEVRDGAIYQVVEVVTHQSPDRSVKSYTSTFLGTIESVGRPTS